MKFKNIQGFEIFVNKEGKIAIIQDSFEFGKPVGVYLTLEQFLKIERWVDANEEHLLEVWNEGVEDA